MWMYHHQLTAVWVWVYMYSIYICNRKWFFAMYHVPAIFIDVFTNLNHFQASIHAVQHSPSYTHTFTPLQLNWIPVPLKWMILILLSINIPKQQDGTMNLTMCCFLLKKNYQLFISKHCSVFTSLQPFLTHCPSVRKSHANNVPYTLDSRGGSENYTYTLRKQWEHACKQML